MSTEMTVSSVAEFLDRVNNFPRKAGRVRYYYRGNDRRQHRLLPKLIRPGSLETLKRRYRESDPVALQSALLQRFRRYASHYHLGGEHRAFRGGAPTLDEWLCVAQHHGLPTLLLDWTLDPLMALFFAVRASPRKAGRVWYLRLKPKQKRKSMTVHLEDRRSRHTVTLQEESSTPLLVVPWVYTSRIEAQSGRFTYSGHHHSQIPLDELEGPTPWKRIRSFIIPAKSKARILRELRFSMIHEGSVFPDLDGIARYLSQGGL